MFNTKLLSKSLFSWLLGSAIFIVLIAVVEYTLGWRQVLQQWQQLTPSYLLIASICFASSYILRAIRIYVLCYTIMAPHFIAVVKLNSLHLFANNIMPMRLGEAAFPILLKRYFGVSLTDGLLNLLWLRLIDAIIAGGLLFFCLASVFTWWWWCAAITVLLIAAMVFVWALLCKPILQSLPGFVQLQPIIAKLRATAPNSMRQFALLLLLSLLAWLSKLLAMVMIVTAIDNIPLNAALAAVLGAELSSILPVHGVAGSGTFEAAFMSLLVPLGFADTARLGTAVNLHVFVLGSSAILTLLCWFLPATRTARKGRNG